MPLRGATTDEKSNHSTHGRGEGRQALGGFWSRKRTHPGAVRRPLQGGDFQRRLIKCGSRLPQVD